VVVVVGTVVLVLGAGVEDEGGMGVVGVVVDDGCVVVVLLPSPEQRNGADIISAANTKIAKQLDVFPGPILLRYSQPIKLCIFLIKIK